MRKNMKKTLLILTFAFIYNINSSEYVIPLDKKHYKESIVVKDYITCEGFNVLNETRDACYDPAPTCISPEILNETRDACYSPVPTCTFPNVLNNANDACINTFDKVGWIDRTDSCQGVRQISTNMFVLRSKTNVRNNTPIIPEGYSWANYQEFNALPDIGYNYYNQCGQSGHSNQNGQPQYEISFSNTASSSYRTHSGTKVGRINTGWNYPNYWLGIVVVKN
jgi:hypothetical protein